MASPPCVEDTEGAHTGRPAAQLVTLTHDQAGVSLQGAAHLDEGQPVGSSLHPFCVLDKVLRLPG